MQPDNSSQRNLPDLRAEEKLSQWLETAGFKWNPFSKTNAQDEPHLGEYFIYPVGFGEILDRSSTVLYASRGGGKTACRRMVEHSCAIGDVGGNVFSVTYDDFQGVVQQANGDLKSITTQMHVEAILRNTLLPLFGHRVQRPKIVEVPPGELTATQRLERFFDLVKIAGFDALFILIDNVDGLPETNDNPQACATLLSELVGTASLMNLPGVFFKFFLPLDTRPLLEMAFNIRQIRPVVVEWPDEKLHQVLEERLKAATQEGRPWITSLDAVSERQLRGKIDRVLVESSETPRDLVLLGQKVFRAHIYQPDYITVEELELVTKVVVAAPQDVTPWRKEKKYLSAILAIENKKGIPVGTGFLTSLQGKTYAVTCAHVICAALKLEVAQVEGSTVTLSPSLQDGQLESKVRWCRADKNRDQDYWSAKDDIAILEIITPLQEEVLPIYLSEHTSPRLKQAEYSCFDYIQSAEGRGSWLEDISYGPPVAKGFIELSQLEKVEIKIEEGASGAPLLDRNGECVGMIQSVNTKVKKAYLTPTNLIYETLLSLIKEQGGRV